MARSVPVELVKRPCVVSPKSDIGMHKHSECKRRQECDLHAEVEWRGRTGGQQTAKESQFVPLCPALSTNQAVCSYRLGEMICP